MLKSKAAKIIVGLVALAVLGGVGGPYVYIHFIKEDAPKPLGFDAFSTEATAGDTTAAAVATDAASETTAAPDTVAATDTTAAAAAAGDASSDDLSGNWAIAQPSTAGYRVKEILFGQSTEGVGRTTSVSGNVTIADGAITEGTITVDLTTLASDSGRRDSQVQNRLLQTSQFPTATFTVNGPVTLPAAPAAGATATLDLPGKLNLHGVDKDVTISLQVQRADAGFQVVGSTDIVFADYGIEDPSNAAVQTENHGLLELALTFTKG